jgi:hypothetical protein
VELGGAQHRPGQPGVTDQVLVDELAPVVTQWHPIDPDDRDVDEMRLAGLQCGLDHTVDRVNTVHDRVHTDDRLGEPFASADVAGGVLRGTGTAAAAAEHPHPPSGVEQVPDNDPTDRAGATGDQDQVRHVSFPPTGFPGQEPSALPGCDSPGRDSAANRREM